MTPLKHSPLPRLSHKLFPLPTAVDLPTPSSTAPSTIFSALNTSTYKSRVSWLSLLPRHSWERI